MDTEAYMQNLLVSHSMREPILQSAVRALELPIGSSGLDAGCGIGLPALLLSDEVGPNGHVTGLDIAPEFLSRALETVKEAGLSERISFRQGSVDALPFDDDTFDWVWSADCVGYGQRDSLPLLKELARVVKPGGTVAIIAWSSENLIPGYPLLEAKLTATSSGIAPFAKGSNPELHFLRALGWFRRLGLEDPKAQVFAGSACAPLSNELCNALTALFESRWPGVEAELSKEDLDEFHRLCKPESPDFILNHPDYYAFFTYSLFRGKVPNL